VNKVLILALDLKSDLMDLLIKELQTGDRYLNTYVKINSGAKYAETPGKIPLYKKP
jgi:hypothetical protein